MHMLGRESREPRRERAQSVGWTGAEPGPHVGTRARVIIDILLLALLVACVISSTVDVGVLRAALVLPAASFVPGWAVLAWVPPADLLTTVALAVAFSLAIEILGSLFLGWIGWWRPEVLAVGLAVASAALLIGELRGVTTRRLASIERK